MEGNIPVLFVEGEGLAEAWEKSVLSVYNEGCNIKTEYDKPDDPPSKDCSMTIVVKNPLAEPMIHRDFPGGFEDLQEYVLEVLDGIKDHLIRTSAKDTDDTKTPIKTPAAHDIAIAAKLMERDSNVCVNIVSGRESIVIKSINNPVARVRAVAIIKHV